MKNIVITALLLTNIVTAYLLINESTDKDMQYSKQEVHPKEKQHVVDQAAINPNQYHQPKTELLSVTKADLEENNIDDNAAKSDSLNDSGIASNELIENDFNGSMEESTESLCEFIDENHQCQVKEDINITSSILTNDSVLVSSALTLLSNNSPEALIEKLQTESNNTVSYQHEQIISDISNEINIKSPDIYLQQAGCSDKLCFSIFKYNDKQSWDAATEQSLNSLGANYSLTSKNHDTGEFETRIFSVPNKASGTNISITL